MIKLTELLADTFTDSPRRWGPRELKWIAKYKKDVTLKINVLTEIRLRGFPISPTDVKPCPDDEGNWFYCLFDEEKRKYDYHNPHFHWLMSVYFIKRTNDALGGYAIQIETGEWKFGVEGKYILNDKLLNRKAKPKNYKNIPPDCLLKKIVNKWKQLKDEVR